MQGESMLIRTNPFGRPIALLTRCHVREPAGKGEGPPNMDAWRTDCFLQFVKTNPPILWKWFRHKG